MGQSSKPETSKSIAVLRKILQIALILAFAWTIHLVLDWAHKEAEIGGLGMRIPMLIVFLVVYSFLIAVPFVPGIEIGLTLLVIEGPWIAPWVYLATVLGLSIAYGLGEKVPYRRLERILSDLRLERAAHLLEQLRPLDREERLTLLKNRLPLMLRTAHLAYRYVLLGILVNLPGNSIIGGGGGIFFTAGFSRLFRPLWTIITIVLAVAPVPLMVWLFNVDLMELMAWEIGAP